MADRIAETLTFAQVIDEILVSFTDRDDWPSDHRCTKPGGHQACSHTDFAGEPLLKRLRELIVPGTAPAKEDPGKRSGGKRHSPAPWDRKAGELVDEILRGAVDFADRVRLVLGFTPQPQSGEAALRELVVLLPLLRERHPRHHLAAYQPVGEVPSWEQPPEPAVRSWHQQALLITGHQRPWPRVTQVPNPSHPDNCAIGDFLLGPTCLACAHPTCLELRSARYNRWVQARCPHCLSASLRQNPVTQSIECQRPRCRDEHGQRHVWSIAELRALGVAIEERASA